MTGSTARTANDASAAARKSTFIDPSFFHLFWIFVIASFIGLLAETVVSAFQDGFVKDRAGLVWGPFSPLYGLGAVVMTVALNRLKGKSPLVLFCVSALAGGATEFAAGWFWENFFGIVAWSYIDQPLNIGGYTCAAMMVVWGLAGVAWAYAGIPLVMRIIDKLPRKRRTLITTLMGAFMALDIVTTLLCFNFWFERLSGDPVTTPIEQFFNAHYGNEWMADRFQTMSVWTDLAEGRD